MIITTSLVWEISDLANLKKEVFMEIVGAADGADRVFLQMLA